MSGKRITIRTSMLEEKATACNMLCCYADELKTGFFPYVEQVSFALAAYRPGSLACLHALRRLEVLLNNCRCQQHCSFAFTGQACIALVQLLGECRAYRGVVDVNEA